MRVYNQYTTGVPQVHFRFFDFDRFSHSGDFLFIDSPQIFTDVPKEVFDQKVVYLELEEPNRFFVDVDWFNHFEFDKRFSKVLSICPYTTKWLNETHSANHTYVFMPICYQPQENEKTYDIIYAGHIYPGEIETDVSVLKDFHYKVVSNTNHPLTTNRSATHEEKLKLISQSKITLVHNLLYPTEEHIRKVRAITNYQDNEAFAMLDRGIVPQIKVRALEAAQCKSLILCQRDPWNVIENYFEPDKEFIYYDKTNAKEQILHILAHYEDYLSVIENAYIKVQNYTTTAFFNQYLKDLS
jgi:glycosyl transferase family 1